MAMKWSQLAFLLTILLASPAHAEKLTFDHRTYPPLQTVLDSGRTEMIRYDDSNPKYVTDRIVTQGTSVDNWTEALDIIVRLRGSKMKSAADWANEIQRNARALCASTFTTLAEDANSRTFLRQSTGCPAGVAQTGLYRIVAGRKSLFMLNAFTLGVMSEPVQQQWLALLGSAHIAS
jgi:hypothetical protein